MADTCAHSEYCYIKTIHLRFQAKTLGVQFLSSERKARWIWQDYWLAYGTGVSLWIPTDILWAHYFENSCHKAGV